MGAMHWFQPERSGGSCLPANRSVETKRNNLSEGFFRLMMLLKKIFFEGSNNQPKRKEKRGRRRSLSSQGTVFDIDCARSCGATANWLWMSSGTLYLSIALPLNMVGGDLDFDKMAGNQWSSIVGPYEERSRLRVFWQCEVGDRIIWRGFFMSLSKVTGCPAEKQM